MALQAERLRSDQIGEFGQAGKCNGMDSLGRKRNGAYRLARIFALNGNRVYAFGQGGAKAEGGVRHEARAVAQIGSGTQGGADAIVERGTCHHQIARTAQGGDHRGGGEGGGGGFDHDRLAGQGGDLRDRRAGRLVEPEAAFGARVVVLDMEDGQACGAEVGEEGGGGGEGAGLADLQSGGDAAGEFLLQVDEDERRHGAEFAAFGLCRQGAGSENAGRFPGPVGAVGQDRLSR